MMQRVMIIGGPGSGKTTLAIRLGEITGLPVYHMDQIHHLPGWIERERSEKDRMSEEVHAKDAWIFEGNLSSTYQSRVARADTCIWLDLHVSVRLLRVFWRTLRYLGQDRPSLPENCPERFTWEFTSYIWRSRKTAGVRAATIKLNPPTHLTFVHLRSGRAANAYLDGLRLTEERALAHH